MRKLILIGSLSGWPMRNRALTRWHFVMFLSELVITGNLSKIMIFRIFVEMKNCEIEG